MFAQIKDSSGSKQRRNGMVSTEFAQVYHRGSQRFNASLAQCQHKLRLCSLFLGVRLARVNVINRFKSKYSNNFFVDGEILSFPDLLSLQKTQNFQSSNLFNCNYI